MCRYDDDTLHTEHVETPVILPGFNVPVFSYAPNILNPFNISVKIFINHYRIYKMYKNQQELRMV